MQRSLTEYFNPLPNQHFKLSDYMDTVWKLVIYEHGDLDPSTAAKTMVCSKLLQSVGKSFEVQERYWKEKVSSSLYKHLVEPDYRDLFLSHHNKALRNTKTHERLVESIANRCESVDYDKLEMLLEPIKEYLDSPTANPKAQFYLALTYRTNNTPEYVKYLELSAEQGFAEAQLFLGDYCFNEDEEKSFNYYKRAADGGSVKTQYRAYYAYKNAEGTEENKEEEFKYLKMGADNGHVKCQHSLGKFYKDTDSTESFKYFLLAAAQGCRKSQLAVACMYKDGIGIEKDLKKAFKYFKHLADVRNCELSKHQVALCYEKGLGTEIDSKKAFEYYVEAADYYEENNDFIEAVSVYQKVATYFKNGVETVVDLEKAFKYLELAKYYGSGEVLKELADCYENGYGTPVDKVKAVKYYKLSENKDLAEARKFKAIYYETKEYKHMKLSADLGDEDMQHELARNFDQTRDFKNAFDYYKKAADQSHGAALFNVGRFHEKGIITDVDFGEAVKFYLLALNLGHKGASFPLANCYKELKDFENAFKYYTLTIEKDLSDYNIHTSSFEIAICHEKGLGTIQSYADAFNAYKVCADSHINDINLNDINQIEARFKVGRFYHLGLGVAPNTFEAFKYYKLSADNLIESGKAAKMVADCFMNGIGTDVNWNNALYYYKLAADKGFQNLG